MPWRAVSRSLRDWSWIASRGSWPGGRGPACNLPLCTHGFRGVNFRMACVPRSRACVDSLRGEVRASRSMLRYLPVPERSEGRVPRGQARGPRHDGHAPRGTPPTRGEHPRANVPHQCEQRRTGRSHFVAWHSPLWHLLNLTHRDQNNVAGYTAQAPGRPPRRTSPPAAAGEPPAQLPGRDRRIRRAGRP
jgi:hypothetical protein